MPEHIVRRRGNSFTLSTGDTVSAEGRARVFGTLGDTKVSMGVVLPAEIVRAVAESGREGCGVVNHGGLPAPLRGNTKVQISITLCGMKSAIRRNVRRWMEKNADLSWQRSESLFFGSVVETLTVVLTVKEYNERKTPAVGPVVSWRDDAKSGAFKSPHINGRPQGKRRTSRQKPSDNPRKRGVGLGRQAKPR